MTSPPKLKVLYELPEPSTLDNSDESWSLIQYEYFRDGEWYRSGLKFKHVAAARMRIERAAALWHLEAYNKLVEVEHSDWVEEIRADTEPPQYRHRWQMHHYLIYVRDDGAFEFIADSWEVLPPEKVLGK